MILVLVFGEEKVRSWIIKQDTDTSHLMLKSMFNKQKGKLTHSVKYLGLIS